MPSRRQRARLAATGALAVALTVAGCGGSGSAGPTAATTSTTAADTSASAPAGLVAYVDGAGVEVADPLTGASRLVVPISSLEIGSASNQRFLIDGPAWATTATTAHPVLYFVLHDLRADGGAADVFMRADPFAGTMDVVAAVPDPTGSTSGLVAVPGALAFSSGCCQDLFVEVISVNGGTPRVLSPAGNGFWESLGGADNGRVAAVHQVGTQRNYVWLDASTGATRPLAVPATVPASSIVGGVTVDAAGDLEALAAGSPSSGGISINGAVDVVDLATGVLKASRPVQALGLGMSFSPDGSALAVSTGGTLSVIPTTPGATSAYKLPAGGNDAQSPSWSAPVAADGFGALHQVSPSASSLVQVADANLATSTTTSSTSSTTTSSTSTSTTTGSTTTLAPPPVTTTPELYVQTGANPGTLYPEPDFPRTVVVDNHDYIDGLTWTGMGPTTNAVGNGTYHIDNCVPNCAAGTYSHYPIQLTASQPRHCTVQVYDQRTNGNRSQFAYVYNVLQARMSGGPQAQTPQFGPACS